MSCSIASIRRFGYNFSKYINIRYLCLLLIFYTIISTFFFIQLWKFDSFSLNPSKIYSSIIRVKKNTVYKYTPFRGFQNLAESDSNYVFQWNDWVNLSAVYLNKDYSNIAILKSQLQESQKDRTRLDHDLKKRLVAFPPSHPSNIIDKNSPSSSLDSSRTCDWNQFFLASSYQRTIYAATKFRYCNHNNFLAFVAPQPAKIIVLSPDLLHSSDNQSSSLLLEKRDVDTVNSIEDVVNFENVVTSQENKPNSDSIFQNPVFPGNIDSYPIHSALVRSSQPYSHLNPFDPKISAFLANLNHLSSLSDLGTYGSKNKTFVSKNLSLPRSLVDISSNIFPLHIVLTPVDRYLLNNEKLDSLKKSGDILPDSAFYSIFTSPKLPKKLSLDPKNENILQAYDPTYEELIRRVHLAIANENLLPPFYENSILLSKDSSLGLVDFKPNDWKIPSFPELESYYNRSDDSTGPNPRSKPKSSKSLHHPERQSEALKVSPDGPTTEEFSHALFLNKYHLAASRLSKYFYECDHGDNADHLDYRFFRNNLSPQNRNAILHHLFRAWSKFSEAEGIVSWLAHGTLLGWYWDGTHLSWDSDIDIQMSAIELDRVARKYNNTLVVDLSEEYVWDDSSNQPFRDSLGNRRIKITNNKYLLDISSRYVSRGFDNGQNFIDGRFIDVSTGVYIDITGLSQNPTNGSEYGCKNNHFYTLDDIYPLRKTLFEGAPTYVPNNVVDVLRKEYKFFDQITARRPYIFNRFLSLWSTKFECRTKLSDINAYDTEFWNTTRLDFLKNMLVGPSFTRVDENGTPRVGGYVEDAINELKHTMEPNSAGYKVAEEADKMIVFENFNEYNEQSNFCDDMNIQKKWKDRWKLSTLHQMEMAYLEQVLDGDRELGDGKKVANDTDEVLPQVDQNNKDEFGTPDKKIHHVLENQYKKTLPEMTEQEVDGLKVFVKQRPASFRRLMW